MQPLYTLQFTKEQLIFLSALTGSMTTDNTIEILSLPLEVFSSPIGKEHYWDNVKALEYLSKQPHVFLDQLYDIINTQAEQFKGEEE